MKLIGVTGKAGSGKTTFSDMLAQYPEIGVVHVDNIIKDIKLKYFKFLMKENKQGEKTKVDARLKTSIYKNKILFNLFMKFRAKLIEKPLERQISQLEQLGKTTILIDDIFLQYESSYEDLNLILLMTRPYITRKTAIMERDDITKEEVVAYDVAHRLGNYKELKNGHTITINNNQGKEELQILCEKLHEKYIMPFKEKCRVNSDSLNVRHSKEKVRPRQIDRSKEERAEI